MLFEISKEIAALFSAANCPYKIVYGPERSPSTIAQSRVVIEYDRQGSDTTKAPKGRFANPPMVSLRSVACTCRIFAKSSLAGAGIHNHEREANALADLFLVAIHKVVRSRCSEYRITRAKFLSVDELKYTGLETWPGAVYEISFEVDRGVFDTTWTGEKSTEATIGGTGGVGIQTSLTVGGTATGNNVMPSVSTEIE